MPTLRRCRAILLPLALLACQERDERSSSSGDEARSESRALHEETPEMAADAAATRGKAAIAPELAPPAPPAPLPAGGPAYVRPETTASAMLIRTGEARVEVDSLEPAVAAVRALATRLGGYVANSSLQTGREQIRSATLELKIPAPRFDQAIGGLAPIGRVEAVDVRAEDVGEEFTDVSARVANAKRLEARLLELLDARAGRLQDVLNVERELARVREEIERYEGRLRYLRNRVALSTLHVTVHEPVPILGAAPGTNVLAEAAKSAWRNFIGFVAGFIASLGILLPLAALAAAGWWGWRRLRRTRATKRSAEPPASRPTPE